VPATAYAKLIPSMSTRSMGALIGTFSDTYSSEQL
jgi:hypothetical protein